ncbi:MAG: long-chain-acyl-CoA synthetase [Phenylobacterium sp.]|nr:long-chain-acyl-CoA synthetase [Phenylobacterium sp.]
MRLKDQLARELRYIRKISRTLPRVKSVSPDSANLVCDDLQAAMDKWRDRPAMTFEGRTVTYAELDGIANRYAHWATGLNLRRGQTVALFMPNRLEYFCIWYGLSKVGVVTALINNQLTGAGLAHCLNISGASHCIVDPETSGAFEEVKDTLETQVHQWMLGEAHNEQRDLVQALKSCSHLPPDRSVREGMTARDTCLYIFTSGTTGLPKAAPVTHMRAQFYMLGFAGATGGRETDRIYVTLPLYHATGGLCALGAALLNGGSVVLKKKFSASQFWPDISAEGCTMFVYIGELCRYLVNHPVTEVETQHKLRLAFGNGLRPDVWPVLTSRFRIPDVLEFYGSTEGNVSMFNFDGKVGSIGRIPSYLRRRMGFKLVQFDVENEVPVRGPDGFCIACGVGQIGECIGRISNDPRTEFTGYLDKAASEKKILRDVFEKGDAWFRTGDLMQQDAEGYYYFIDRIGDTFRWKGENVSTNEVSARLQEAPGVLEANVYGVEVPGADGRAGMAALVTDETFDLEAFNAHVGQELAPYAQPLFLRMMPAMEVTGTFKQRKVELVAEGFDPAKVKTPLYFKDPEKGYVKITKTVFTKLTAGGYRI